jgi:hypothetical protein
MNQKSAVITFLFLSAPLSSGLLATIVCVYPQGAWHSLLARSLALISIGKISQFRKGRWVSFGSNGMDKLPKNLYLAGWLLLIMALVFTAMVKLNA